MRRVVDPSTRNQRNNQDANYMMCVAGKTAETPATQTTFSSENLLDTKYIATNASNFFWPTRYRQCPASSR